jgi:hypothetical protein
VNGEVSSPFPQALLDEGVGNRHGDMAASVDLTPRREKAHRDRLLRPIAFEQHEAGRREAQD